MPRAPHEADRPAPLAASPLSDDSRGLHPATLGKFHLRGVLGEGGMGVVYEAEQDQPRRTVALKVIRAGLASPELAAPLRARGRGARPPAAPGHRADLRGRARPTARGGPQPYFAMELVRGRPLTDLRREARARPRASGSSSSPGSATPSSTRTSAASSTATSSRRTSSSTTTGQPKILDFGVARAHRRRRAGARCSTDVGAARRHAAVHEPRAGRRRPARRSTRAPTSTRSA